MAGSKKARQSDSAHQRANLVYEYIDRGMRGDNFLPVPDDHPLCESFYADMQEMHTAARILSGRYSGAEGEEVRLFNSLIRYLQPSSNRAQMEEDDVSGTDSSSNRTAMQRLDQRPKEGEANVRQERLQLLEQQTEAPGGTPVRYARGHHWMQDLMQNIDKSHAGANEPAY